MGQADRDEAKDRDFRAQDRPTTWAGYYRKSVAFLRRDFWKGPMTPNTHDFLTNDICNEYPGKGSGTLRELEYLASGFVSEAAEILGKIQKEHRERYQEARLKGMDPLDLPPSDKLRHSLVFELGDGEWYANRTRRSLKVTLEQVLEANYLKLKDRTERGTINGEGDNR